MAMIYGILGYSSILLDWTEVVRDADFLFLDLIFYGSTYSSNFTE